MGAVKIDITEETRRYTQTYALNTSKGVEKLLRNRYKIAARRFIGDYAACDIILDLNKAIDRAQLSRRQAETVTFLYDCGLTQEEAACEMGVSQPAVGKFKAEACRKIAGVLKGWNYGEVSMPSRFDYIELFAGIGGFRSALDELGGHCVFASEIDKFAQRSYRALYNGAPELHGDITQIDARDIPDHDLLVAGVPCQAWSVAGKRKGFEDERGSLWQEVERILRVKKPKAFLIENVKGLLSHDKGRSFEVIGENLSKTGYGIDFEIVNSKHYGVPQNRERIFIIGIRLEKGADSQRDYDTGTYQKAN